MEEILLKPKTRKQLAEEYGIDRKTLYLWLKHLNLPVKGGMLTPRCLEMIYGEIGYPVNNKHD